ncbi:MAG TPA: very short patch repair endonuclease [Allosphingosinicella sp.]
MTSSTELLPNDHLTPEQRSRNMSRIRGSNTKPELAVRKMLHRAGFRFRLHRRDLPGTPDIVLPRHRVAVFVHGCFWHGHEECRRSALPKTRREFWAEKIARNRARDLRATEALRAAGFSVVTLWECQIHDTDAVLNEVRALALNNAGARHD